jgi:hypothetical protein
MGLDRPVHLRRKVIAAMSRPSLTAALARLAELRTRRGRRATKRRDIVVRDDSDRAKLLAELDVARFEVEAEMGAGRSRDSAVRSAHEHELMQIHASVIEVLSSDETKGRGEFGFLQLPAAGDRIVVPSASGGRDIFQVHYVEHHPMQIPTPALEVQRPTVLIFATWIGNA